jgi:hypothetical protein
MSIQRKLSLWFSHQEFEWLLSWYYRKEVFMRYAVESASYDMVFVVVVAVAVVGATETREQASKQASSKLEEYG